MKKKKWLKWLLIILIVGFVFSIATPVLAKVKFGNWDRWDEELPPADNEAWHWAIKTNEPRIWTLKGFGDSGSDVVLLFSDIYFYGDKKGKTKASMMFYSSGMNVKKWDISNASLALAAFLPEKGKMIIRAYKRENKVFKWFEEWEIPFKEKEIVVPKDAKFRSELEEWLKTQLSFKSQVPSGRTIPQDLIDSMLPELIIGKKNTFMISYK